MNLATISTDDLIDELKQATHSLVELEAQINFEGDKIVGSEGVCGAEADVYLSDIVEATKERLTDIHIELVKRKSKIIHKRSEVLQ